MTPSLVYAECPLDRSAHRRSDAVWLEARLLDPVTQVLPVWRGCGLVTKDERPRLAAVAGAEARSVLALAAEAVFLGTDSHGVAWFAADISSRDEAESGRLAGDRRFADLRQIGAVIDRGEGAVLAYARAIVHWHRHHRFCGACGAATVSAEAGHVRRCTATGCGETMFPRTDPVVIMLVTRRTADGDACVLARQARWTPGLMSTLAGFVEPGESLEQAVAREVREEIGLNVRRVHYRASQPWPFPLSLMVGFRAEADASEEITCMQGELEVARWFERDAVAAHVAAGGKLPFRGTIARALIDGWLEG